MARKPRSRPASPDQLEMDLPEHERLCVDVDGFEGPIDVLLVLARKQKVDLTKIAIVALVEQYLAFVADAKRLRLELAADYLVMAAWLAYLKSRLLLPREEQPAPEPSGEDMAAQLAFRLARLEAMRAAAEQLTARPQLGEARFARGAPEPMGRIHGGAFEASLYDLLTAYARQRQAKAHQRVAWGGRTVWSIKQARTRLEAMLGITTDWITLDALLEWTIEDPHQRASMIASSFSASLELARDGRLDMRQERAFAPLHLRPLISNGAAP